MEEYKKLGARLSTGHYLTVTGHVREDYGTYTINIDDVRVQKPEEAEGHVRFDFR